MFLKEESIEKIIREKQAISIKFDGLEARNSALEEALENERTKVAEQEKALENFTLILAA